MKKSLTLLLTPLVLTSLVSCGPKKYTVVWQNYDETVLETDLKVKKGEMPNYDGATPTRETDETYVYEFTGWSPELTEVSKDIVYVAQYKATAHYHITFANYDNATLYEKEILEGEMPQYVGEAPTRATDDSYVYEFIGWSPELTQVSKDTTFVAQFKATPYYHISFVDYDNTILYETTALEGETPKYKGDNPEREEDESFSYDFIGWTPNISAASQNTTYVATYKSTPLVYHHVTFVNYDDSVLYETDVVEGRAVTYKGETPTKPEDDEFKYEFEGWDQNLSPIMTDVTIKAKYKEIAKVPWGPIEWA